MGISLARRNSFIVRALIASLALHLIFALFVPTLAWLRSDGPAVETISFVHVMRISVATPKPVPRIAAASALKFAPVPHAARVVSRARLARKIRAVRSAQPAGAPLVAAPESGSATVQTAATGAPATPVPQQREVATSETRHDNGGYMPFGADVPVPVLDPSVVRSLTDLKVHVTLTVVVDENGHTKSVAFDPPLDSGIEDQIRTMLAAASWDPAVCGGGVSCEGRTTIKL